MLVPKSPDDRVHRVGYPPDPWAWTPWEYIDRATGRWDDPLGTYRVLYGGTTPFACFVEVLAVFRPDDLLREETLEIEPDDRDGAYPTIASGIVPRSWLEERRLGSANLSGSFLDVAHAETIAKLREDFLARALHYGLPDFDAAAIRIREPRDLTREISRFVYELDRGAEPIDGIAYESRYGSGLDLWAIFERGADVGLDRSRLLADVDSEELSVDTPGLLDALHLHGLAIL